MKSKQQVQEKLVQVSIDDITVSVPPETTILEAAESAGVQIPTLCHHKELSPSGACRVCIVEISRPDRNPDVSWIDSACVCPVAEGFHIRTNSEKVRRERKLILELLLSRAPSAPAIVQLAAADGITSPQFTASDGGESSCILCGLCVRVCNELIGADAIGTARRGVSKEITSPFFVAQSLCIGCLACVNVCPTGVIEFQVQDGRLKREEWGVDMEILTCPDCGTPVGAGTQMTGLKTKVSVTDEMLAYCPSCRRKKIYSASTAKQFTGV